MLVETRRGAVSPGGRCLDIWTGHKTKPRFSRCFHQYILWSAYPLGAIPKILYEPWNEMIYSFAKPAKPQRLAGARFDDGKIAYQDEASEIRGAESEKKLKEALPSAVVEALADEAV